jgi:predicted transcriptional regulator
MNSQLQPIDMGSGYTLVFQHPPMVPGGTGAVDETRVRAVVKNAAGKIVARGSVVLLANIAQTKREAALEFTTLSPMFGSQAPHPQQDQGRDDSDDEDSAFDHLGFFV